MAVAQTFPELEEKKRRWVALASELAQDVAQWAAMEGWKVRRESRLVRDAEAGDFEVPGVVIELPQGELQLKPMALNRGVGRIDLQAIPTLNRVRFLAKPEGWVIMTDSHVPLRVPWTRESFVQLANDLLAWLR